MNRVNTVDERETTDAERPADVNTPTASIELFADFEQHRMLTNIRGRLFGCPARVQIGRYRVERRLGAGGMGEVYLAVDDELQRKVAVKRVLAGTDDVRSQQRLRSEARALARLTHTNVVQVYEVGEHDGRTFIAMQYIEGQTLADWLTAEPRRWPAILERFIAAGRGLAAIHRAGLVHRDFKPDNVLIGDDGEVRVVDLGLVMTGDDRGGPSDPQANPAELRTSVTGQVMGTIRYMPLEQLRGATVDARSDQFSFCVSLYEALWGRPPFELDNPFTRLAALEDGRMVLPRPGLPPALWRAIRRGLAREAASRWPDMDTLLAALERVPRRRRSIAAAAGLAVVASVGLGVAAMIDDAVAPLGPVDPCASIERELAGIWDQPTRAQIEARFGVDSSAAHVEASRERVLAGLDGWADAWLSERERVCRASADGSSAPQLAQLQGACLIRQQQKARALVELLGEADSDGLARAVEAVAELPPPATCATELALLGVDAPAADIADTVEQLRVSLDRAHELRLLGQLIDAHALAEQVVAQAIELGYAPLLAEARAELGKAEIVGGSLERGLELLRLAIEIAEIHHHDHLAASLWIELTLRVLVDVDDPEAGARELNRAEVAYQRANRESARLAARLHFARATLASALADPSRAEHELRAAIALVDDPAGPDLASYLDALARAVERRDRGEALGIHREALAAAERNFGPAHPETGAYLYALAAALHGDGQTDEATALFERAAAIWTASHARPHRNLAQAERTLAQLALRRGDLDSAHAHALALARVQAAILPAGHHELGDPQLLLAAVEGIRGDDAAALAHCRAALDLWEPSRPAGDGRLTQARSRAAAHLVALGRLAEAEPLYAQVIEHGKPRFRIAAHNGLAELALLRGQPDAAIDSLRAIDRLIADEPALLGAEALAYRLLWALAELRRGREIDARVQALLAAREGSPITAAQLEAWLDRLGLSADERRALGLLEPAQPD